MFLGFDGKLKRYESVNTTGI
jgi:hypothetical protein